MLTCANAKEAQKITNALLDKKLAACVRRVSVTSDYLWRRKRQHDREVQLIIESAEDKFDEIETTVRSLHSYETFVLMAYPVLKSSAGVEQWIKESLGVDD